MHGATGPIGPTGTSAYYAGRNGPVGPSNPPAYPVGVTGPVGPTGPMGPPPRVKVWQTEVPGREKAFVELWYDHESGCIYAMARQMEQGNGMLGNTTVVFKFDGDIYKAEARVNGKDSWADLATMTAGARSPNLTEAVALRVLSATGTYCKSQAFTDLLEPEICSAPAWQQILDEARELHSVCQVMMR